MEEIYTTEGGLNIQLAAIVLLAEDAGSRILDIYSQESDSKIKDKSDSSPLTHADMASNSVICDRLRELHPDIPIMSEENKNADYGERKKWSLYWCIDPLDGTKEFLQHNGEFTVNIALMAAVDSSAPQIGARPVVGVVHAPVLGTTYFAADGLGAFLRKNVTCPSRITIGNDEKTCAKPAQASRIHCEKFSTDDKGLVLVCSRSHLDDRTKEFLSRFDAAQTKSMGSSLKFMLVATGEAHVYPRLAPTMEWDTAASQIIVEQAGGSVIVHDTGKVMRYNKEDLRNPYFCVYGCRS